MKIKIKNLPALFLKNLGLRQTVIKNTFWLAVSEAIFRLSQFLLIIYSIRILGATEFGKFTFALSFVAIFATISDFGLSDIATRELSQDKKNEKEYSGILSLKILLSVASLILITIGSFFIASDIIIKKIIWILGFSVIINNFFFIICAFFRARQQMEYEAGAKIIQSLIMVCIVIFVLFNFPLIENVSWGYLIANLASFILLLLFFHFYIQPLKLSFDKNLLRKFFRFSQPLGFSAIFVVIILNIDSVMMGRLGQITENGWYSAVRAIVNLTFVLATLIWVSFYPVLSHFFKESKEKFQRVWNYYMESMIILAIPLVMGGLFLAPKIVDFIYGQKFSPSVPAFQILIFAAGINFVYNPYIIMLFVSNQQKKYLWISFIAAIIDVITNIILIPRYSFYGASIAMLITSIFILLSGIEFSRRITHISLFNIRLLKITIMVIFSGLIMLFAISQSMIYHLNVVFSVIAGMLFYFTVLFIFYKFLYKLNWLSNEKF